MPIQRNRAADPRFNPGLHTFVSFRARSINAFAKGVSGGILARLAQAQGLQLEEGLATLEQSYPIPVPIGGFREAQYPRRFDRMGERKITGGTLAWQAGIMEETKKLSRPGAVASLWSQPNKAEQFGASGAALLDRLIVTRLLAGDTGTHGYDDVAFFGTAKKIAPDDPESQTYDNKHTIALDVTDPTAFVDEAKKLFKAVPHPMHTPAAPQWIDQELGGLLVSPDRFRVFEKVARDEQKIVVIKDGATPVGGVTIANTDRGSFSVIESKNMPDNRVLGFARGPGAEAAILVHSLIGLEELPGGDFMAQDVWQMETGTWMMPRIWEIDKNSEYAKINGHVLLGADLDVDAILYAPWSAKMFVIP